jgi:uncharacterized protein involved in copper resistance
MNKLKRSIIIFSVLVLPVSIGYAAKMDHSQHMNMDHSIMQHAPAEPMSKVPVQKGQLQKLSELPASGKAREAGSDGRYAMEATSVKDDIQTKCAKASRGLVMIDNKSWAQCGGKPKGWSEGAGNVEPVDHSQHMMH